MGSEMCIRDRLIVTRFVSACITPALIMDVDTGIGAGLGWPQYLIEAWGITGLALFIMLVRYCVRIRTVGFRGLQGDDAMVLFTIAFTILDASTVTIACEYIDY